MIRRISWKQATQAVKDFKMKTVTTRPSFQGDVMIFRIAALPKNAKTKAAAPENGKFIIAHSETGHHHVIDSRNAQWLIDETNATISYLEVRDAAELVHLRDFDTHETLALQPGMYEIHRQIENSPEGWRRSED